MKSKTMVLMVVAVVCGLVASYLTSQLIAQKNKKIQVLVAKKAIPQWTPIKNPSEMFEQREIPETEAPTGYVVEIKDLQDRVVLKDIAENTAVASTMLQDKSKVGLEGMLSPKTRGIAITVSAVTTAGGFVQPGSHVDVVHTIRTQGGVPDSKMILENVLVRAVDQQPVRPEDKASIVPATVTLELTPEQALKLCQYKEGGSLTLLLRPFGDNTKLEADKGDVALNKPPVEEKKTPRRDKRFIQYISNGPSTKGVPFVERDKKWINDPDNRTDVGPSGSGEGN